MSEIVPNSIPYDSLTQEQRDDAAADMVRKALGYRLASEVDPVFSILWSELTAEDQAEWEAYRLSLLGVTAQSGFPHGVTWPTRPGQGTQKDWLAKLHANPDRYRHPDA
jgi:hypothetical protein